MIERKISCLLIDAFIALSILDLELLPLFRYTFLACMCMSTDIYMCNVHACTHMCMYTHMYVSIYVYAHLYPCNYIFTCVNRFVFSYLRLYAHSSTVAHAHLDFNLCVCKYPCHLHVDTHIYIHTYIMYIYVPMCVYVYVHACLFLQLQPLQIPSSLQSNTPARFPHETGRLSKENCLRG